MIDLSLDTLIAIHSFLEDSKMCRLGIRDKNQLYSSIEGQQWFDLTVDKFIWVSYSINASHIFIDGNKRTSFLVLKQLNNYGIYFNDDYVSDIILSLAKSELTKDMFFTSIKSAIIQANF